MTNLPTFLLAIIALLATPGPTNTLLLTASAGAGFRRSANLLAAELSGYSISVAVLTLLVLPVFQTSHSASIAIRVVCCLYLLYIAWKLFVKNDQKLSSGRTIDFRTVFTTTLLNPKAIVFSLLLLPHLRVEGLISGAFHAAALALCILTVGTIWLSAGTIIHQRAGVRLDWTILRRMCAVVLCVFVVAILTSVFST